MRGEAFSSLSSAPGTIWIGVPSSMVPLGLSSRSCSVCSLVRRRPCDCDVFRLVNDRTELVSGDGASSKVSCDRHRHQQSSSLRTDSPVRPSLGMTYIFLVREIGRTGSGLLGHRALGLVLIRHGLENTESWTGVFSNLEGNGAFRTAMMWPWTINRGKGVGGEWHARLSV